MPDAPAPTPDPASDARRRGAGLLFSTVPIAIGGGIVLAGLLWLVAIQFTSGQARGGWIEVELDAACGQDLRAPLLARLADYGLPGELSPDLRLRFQGPGLPDDLDHMPVALTRPGRFEVWQAGAPTSRRFQDAGVQISITGTATAVVMLDQGLDPDGLQVRIDGLPIEADVNGNELQLHITEATSQDALRQATDWVVAIRHPLPCEARVRSAQNVDAR